MLSTVLRREHTLRWVPHHGENTGYRAAKRTGCRVAERMHVTLGTALQRECALRRKHFAVVYLGEI